MSKKTEFINFIDTLITENDVKVPEPVAIYWEAFKGQADAEKPMFTDNGKLILDYLQKNANVSMWKARDIAEGMFISSRAVSGAMRKLITDGFVEKIGENPSVYAITEKGKEINLD